MADGPRSKSLYRLQRVTGYAGRCVSNLNQPGTCSWRSYMSRCCQGNGMKTGDNIGKILPLEIAVMNHKTV